MMQETLDETNFVLYAAKYYDNPECFDTEEFMSDLKRFKYLRRLFNKYKEDGDLKERLILNHIIVIYNVFGVVPATRMLFFRLTGYYEYLKPFLEFLGYLPNNIPNIGITRKTILCSEIISDEYIEKVLKKI
jgi:hypothetical protein